MLNGTDSACSLLAVYRKFAAESVALPCAQEFAKLHSFLTSVQQSFTYFDRDRSNTLEINEVLQALKHAGASVCVGCQSSSPDISLMEKAKFLMGFDE